MAIPQFVEDIEAVENGLDASLDLIQNLADLFAQSQQVIEINLPASGWSNSYPYIQTVSNSNIKEANSPTLVKILNGTETESEVKSYEKVFGLIFFGQTNNGSVTFYAKALPEIDFVVGLKGV